MRFRNIKPRSSVTGNVRTSLLGRDVRSRLFVPLDSGPLFAVPDLGEKPNVLRVVGEDGKEEPVIQPDPVQWELEDPVPALHDALPPIGSPVDVRPGGTDRPESLKIPPARRFTVTGSTTSHALNVTGATAANCAQVLSALIQDLQRRNLVTRVEA